MSPTVLAAAVLAVVTVLASIRLWRQHATATLRRRVALLVLQGASLALLYLALFPPHQTAPSTTYVLLGPGSSSAQARTALTAGHQVLALPEAGEVAGATAVPDLATALRRFPDLHSATLMGDGLPARDRDAAAQLALQFTPPPLHGLTELAAPAAVAEGGTVTVAGRVTGLPGAQLALHDPADRQVAVQPAANDGQFQLHASVRGAGDSAFTLRVLDANGDTLETYPVPVRVTAAPAVRLWLLSAAPNPSIKYLQRWASDAGLQVHSQASVGGGVQLGDAPRAVSAATLAQTDMLMLDERSLLGLSSAQRQALRHAVSDGLGVLVRLSTAPDSATRAALAQLGLAVRGTGQPTPARLEAGTLDANALALQQGPRAFAAAAGEAAPLLERLQLRVSSADATALLHDVDGNTLGAWRAHGHGRVGVLWLGEDYRWVLAGRDDLHAQLWARLTTQLARPDTREISPQAAFAQPQAWSGERVAVCGLAEGAHITAPGGNIAHPQPDASTPGCAAYWPSEPGWHTTGSGQALYVYDTARGGSLYRAQLARATFGAIATHPTPTASAQSVPGPRWPWLLAWLLCSAALWAWERKRPHA